jgi:osmotically inducible protein OsmC
MITSRKATAVWHGTGLEGTGMLNTPNKFFTNAPYSFKTRFESETGVPGTNPEELLAAAHASCFAMALSFAIAQAGFVADELTVEAKVTLDTVEGGFGITGITLQLAGRVAGMGEAQFLALANGAKAGCPISKALSAVPIHLEATFAA